MRKLFVSLLTLAMTQPLLAQEGKGSERAKMETAVSPAANETTWTSVKAELTSLTESFKDKALPKEKKMKLFPKTNATLSVMQDLKLTPAEKAEQVKIVVDLIVQTFALDYASSNLDTIYFDYEKSKALYDAEISKIKNAQVRNGIKDTLVQMKASTENLDK